MNLLFVVNSAALGVGLAMDAFSVSLANGLHEPSMHRKRICAIAGVYAFFQFIMPMIGWVCVHTIVEAFSWFRQFIPWIALLLLLYIGGKMVLEGLEERKADEEESAAQDRSASGKDLLIQGIATSIDALSVGFTIAIVILAGLREKMEYNDIPAPFKGMPLVLLTSGLMAIAFTGFSALK